MCLCRSRKNSIYIFFKRQSQSHKSIIYVYICKNYYAYLNYTNYIYMNKYLYTYMHRESIRTVTVSSLDE